MNSVHGLAAELVAPDWPAPTWRELAPVLARYGLRPLGGHTWISPRPLSSGLMVTTDTGPVFVKRHSERIRTAAQLGQEHSFASHLARNEIPVPFVLRTLQGATAVSTGGWTYEVHEPAAGSDTYRDAMSWTPFKSVAHARAAGAELARLHLAAAHFVASVRDTTELTSRPELLLAQPPFDANTNEPGLRELLASGDHEVINQALERVAGRLIGLPTQWCHLDWHCSNLFWQGDEVASVIDFGLSDRSYAIVDLALALERNVIRWLELPATDIAEIEQAVALIAGYESVRPLSESERGLLADVLPICHLDFAISEVRYFLFVLGDPRRAAIAWHDYALGHAAWFTTREAADLLAALR